MKIKVQAPRLGLFCYSARKEYLTIFTLIDMKYFSAVVGLFLFSLSSHAQSPKTYQNEAGDQHLAGPFALEVLQTDSLYKPWFLDGFENFELSGRSQAWKENLKNTEVEIYLGTWCGDSKRWVPRFVKIWNELGLDENRLHFIALYDGKELYKQGPNGEEKGKRIHRVPTFVFKENGEEYARMVEYPVNDLETDLAQIALGVASEPNYRAATYLLELFETEPLDSIYQNIQDHFNEVYRLVAKEKELNTLGRVFEFSDRMPQALLTYQFNYVLHPYSPQVMMSYADALMKVEQKDQARDLYQKIQLIDPAYEGISEKLKLIEETEN
ncbi:hypothetical protein [Algoriphagus namhaensis]